MPNIKTAELAATETEADKKLAVAAATTTSHNTDLIIGLIRSIMPNLKPIWH